MIRFSTSSRGATAARVVLFAAAFLLAPAAVAQKPAAAEAPPQETVRVEILPALQAAREALSARNYVEATARLKDAELVPMRTPYENFLILQMRVIAATGSGDRLTAAKTNEALLQTGRLSPEEERRIMQALAGTYYQLKDYPAAVSWANRALKAGGSPSDLRPIITRGLYLGEDYRGAWQETLADVVELEKAGKVPSQETLQLLASAAIKLNDMGLYLQALDRLVDYYPKNELWADLITRTQLQSGFAERLHLDAIRLRYALGLFTRAQEYNELIQRALKAGYPIEAQKVFADGSAKGLIEASAENNKLKASITRDADEDRKAIPKTLVDAKAAKEGTGLVSVGYNMTLADQVDEGLLHLETGIKRGGLRRPEDAKLRFGMALAVAGQGTRAIEVLKTVEGEDGTAALARLWSKFARQRNK